MLALRKGWLSTSYSRRILDQELAGFRDVFQGIVLDVGGRRRGQVQYGPLIGQGVHRWLTLNIDRAAKPHLLADATALPLASRSVNVVICTQVLEHMKQPILAIEEMYRVLRSPDPGSGLPGGVLVLSVPFLYRIHGAPQDYLRFTEYFLRHSVEMAGFRVVQLKKLGLLFAVLCDMIKQAISEVQPAPLRWGLGLLFLPVAELLIVLERCPWIQRSRTLNTYTTGYLLLAEKLGQEK